MIALMLSTSLSADTLSTRSFAALFSSQIDVFDGRAGPQYGGSVRLQPPRAEVHSARGPRYNEQYTGPYLDMARSATGALELEQLMPATARVLRVDPNDPYESLDDGARYLRQQFETFGTWRLALAAYNAGPNTVQRHSGVPPFSETRNYVHIIWGS